MIKFIDGVRCGCVFPYIITNGETLMLHSAGAIHFTDSDTFQIVVNQIRVRHGEQPR